MGSSMLFWKWIELLLFWLSGVALALRFVILFLMKFFSLFKLIYSFYVFEHLAPIYTKKKKNLKVANLALINGGLH